MASFFAPLGPPSAGWTTYPPLSTTVGTPGHGQTLVVRGHLHHRRRHRSWARVNYVTTVIRLRAPGMTYMRLPLTVWGLWLTSILNILFVPVLAAATLLLLLDRVLRHAVLHRRARRRARRRRSHPVPAPVLDLRPPGGLHPDPAGLGHRRRLLAVLRAQAGVLVPRIGLGADRDRRCCRRVVYGHHMFTTGMSPMLGKAS